MFNQINPDELWLTFGTKVYFHYIPIHEVVNKMDPMDIQTLPVSMHSLDVTLFQHLKEEGKRQFGTHGKYFLIQAKHLKISF